jgi:hypothetical protein
MSGVPKELAKHRIDVNEGAYEAMVTTFLPRQESNN